MTVVGDRPVLLDKVGLLATPDATLANLGDAAVLQQAGPAADEVLVATPGALVAVPLGGGKERTLATIPGGGRAAAPVRMPNGCLFAAWATGSKGWVASACGGAEAKVGSFDTVADAELVFRVNRNQIVLNDEKNGTTWTVTTSDPEKISNWEAFQEQVVKDDDGAHKSDAETTQPPKANPDDLGARDGRTTVLHVLDNDLIASDGILSIVDVKGVSRDDVEVRIAPDRQSLLANVAAGASGKVSFRYTIDDGSEKKTSQDDGEVTLTIRNDHGSGTPVLREHAEPRTYPVVAGGVIEFPVTDDWRDRAYGDPIAVSSVRANGGATATTTATGLVRVAPSAGSKGGPQKLSYTVTTGDGDSQGTVTVDVVPAGTRTVSPQTGMDVVSGEVGGTIVVEPLDNDVPGADGADPGARMVLAGPVEPTGGLTVDTDVESGRVTVHAPAPGTYLLDYQAGFGAAKPADGRIRVDVSEASKESDTPVASPDNANAHGTSPIVVDVLANDHDPKGRMLVVQTAHPSLDDSQLEVAVVDGRWIRVNATSPEMVPRSQSVTYTISNGIRTAQGSVNITQRDPLTDIENAPVTQTDHVTVRAGDTVSIPVLDNDATPSGDPVGLLLDESVQPRGELTVLPTVGKAYVSGRQVRFVAPEVVDGPVDVGVQYVAVNVGDPTAPSSVGTVKVHIIPPPSTTNPNKAPTPRALEGRVVQGDRVTLKLPPVGSDSDGDSVAVTGIESPPTRGHVVAWGANSLTYQAFPDATGTDEFRYTVSDRFGATASGSVRIGVVPPGSPQPPLALDDAVTAAPGRTVDIDVLFNDLRTPGTKVKILPLVGAPRTATLASAKGPLTVVAPKDGKATRVAYTITNGLAESSAVLTVKSRAGFENPPVVSDLYATPKPGAASVEVDVLGKAVDVDGPEDELVLDSVTGGARIVRGSVVVPVKDVAQVLAYRVLDGAGAAAAAAIYVPARHRGAPYLRPGAEIVVDRDGSVDADLDDLVIDPEGDPVRLTTDDTIHASPESRLSVEAADEDTLAVSATKEEGPGAVTFEVVDRKDIDDPEAQRAFISVPVRVGDPAPVISCPPEAIVLAAGGAERTVDIASVCHVWTPDGSDADELEYTAEWVDGSGDAMDGVKVDSASAGGIRLAAGTDAADGATGVLAIAAKGNEATGRLSVQVIGLDSPTLAPTLAPIRLEAKQDSTVTVDVAQYVTSALPVAKRDIEIVRVTPYGGASARAKAEGSRLTLTTDSQASGVMRYRLEVTDFAGRSPAVGDVELVVAGPPDRPTNLRVGTEVLAKTVALTWTVPDSNGERIDGYEVLHDGGTFKCPGTPCRVTGLTNGRPYTFRVKAHNAAGWSEPSEPVKGEPDAYTGPVRNLRVLLARDNNLRIGWDAPAPCDCSAVQQYRISSPGIGNVMVPATTREYVVRAANGANTRITVTPLNKKGVADNSGPASAVSGVAAGAPQAPAAPTLTGTNVAGNSQKTVVATWAPVGANGPGPVTYEVRRGTKVVCTWQTATRCTDAGLTTDGTVHSYTVRARNAEATSQREVAVGGQAQHISPPSAARKIEASAPPAAPTITALNPTGRDGTATMTFNVGNSHGAQNNVTCTAGSRSCGSWTFARGGVSGKTVTITGLPDGVATGVVLKACNGGTANLCTSSAKKTVTTFGPVGTPTLNVSTSGRNITWKISVDPNGKPVHYRLLRARGESACPTDLSTGAVLADETSGTTAFTKGSTDIAFADRCYTFELTVTDSSRGYRKVLRDQVRTAPAAKAVYSQKTTKCGPSTGRACQGSTAGCSPTQDCWYFYLMGENFPAPTKCNVYRASGGTVGPTWDMPQGTYTWNSNFALAVGLEHYIKCTNGAVTQTGTFRP
jgi:hypothetical protein